MQLRAAASAASCSSNTVLKSSKTRPSSTRATTAGFERRKRADNSSALSPPHVNAINRVGSVEDGAAPPPRSDSPSTISLFSLDETIRPASASARFPIASFVARIIRSAGIAS